MSESPATGTPAPVAESPAGDEHLSYEQARDELVDVVRKLEAGGATLADSLRLWQRGEQLAAVCQRWLDGARAKLDEVAPAPPPQ